MVATVVATVTGVTPVVAGAAYDASKALAHPLSSGRHHQQAVAGSSVPGNLHTTVTPHAPVVTSPSAGTGSGSTGSTSTAGLKAPLRGLLDRHHAPSTSYKSVISGFVVPVSWASLQPTQGGPIVHPNAIDNAIKIAAANGQGIKLRVEAGLDAPAWAKTLDGPAVTMKYTAATKAKTGTVAGTVGRFWTAKFAAAYQDLQTKLAAAYDNVPQVRETDITRCQTIFAETYLRDTMDRNNAKALVAAGFTRGLDDVCHNQQILAHQVWKHTLSDVAFNPYTAIAPDGSVKLDLAYTLSQMDYCRQVLGARCVLSNHSLADKRITNKNYSTIYAKMRALSSSGPFNFQTATAEKIGSFEKVLSWAGSVGAASVELPTGYTSWSMATLKAADSKM